MPRACNPIVLNTPFMQEDEGMYGAELGLLSPSPPLPERSVPAFPVHIRQKEIIAGRQRKRARSVSCPEAKQLLIHD